MIEDTTSNNESVWTFASDMRRGSEDLVRAIVAARNGKDPRTRSTPVGLPKKRQQRGVSRAKRLLCDAEARAIRDGLTPMNRGQQVAEIISREYTIQEAAIVLGISYRNANGAWQRIRQAYGRQAT